MRTIPTTAIFLFLMYLINKLLFKAKKAYPRGIGFLLWSRRLAAAVVISATATAVAASAAAYEDEHQDDYPSTAIPTKTVITH